MRKTNTSPSLGLLFSTTTALISPAHEAITQRPLYGSVSPLAVRSPLSTVVSRLTATIRRWHRRTAQRKSLRLLDDRMLSDIGLDRSALADELAKPFWRP